MGIGPLRFEPQSSFKFLNSLLGLALIFQRKRQIVMRIRIVGFKVQRFAITRDGLVPGFVARELDGLLAITLSCLRKSWRREQKTQNQQKHRGRTTHQKLQN
jgi:hypothetical protein